MNISSLSIVLALACSAGLHAATVADSVEDAKKRAKESRSDCIVMVYGGDWDRVGKAFHDKCWKAVVPQIDPKAFVSTRLLPQVSSKEAEQEDNQKAKAFGADVPSVPSVFLFDADGFCYASLSGDLLPSTPTPLLTRIAQLQRLRASRDELIQKSQSLKGPEKAKMLGRAGEINGLNRPPDLLKEIQKCDPEDKAGYAQRYTFEIWKLHENLDKPKEEAIAALDAALKSPALTAQQKQKIYGLRGTILRKNKASDSELKENYGKMRALDPQSIEGKAALQAQKAYTK